MRISAVQKFTTLDYPGKTACVVFTAGCNFRCGYCHNPEFVLPEQLKELEDHFIPDEVFWSFLETRRGLLDGVAVSGGEPTLQRELPDFLRHIKQMGFSVKLDTNGALPEILRPMLEEKLVDYVPMDVKTSLLRYTELVGACVRPEAIQESIKLIRELAPDYEFRTTIVREHHDAATLEDMRELVRGARRYALQGFRSGKTLDSAFSAYANVREKELETIGASFATEVDELIFRH